MPAPNPAMIDSFDHQSATSLTNGVYDGLGTTLPAFDTSIVLRSSSRASMKIAPTGAATCFASYTVADSLLCGSFYLRFETLPTTDIAVHAFINASGGSQIRFNGNTDGKLAVFAVGGRTSFGPVLNAGQWYLVDWKYDSSTGTLTMTGRVDQDNTTAGTRSGAQTTANCTAVRIGTGATTETYTAYFEDFILCKNITDYPIGPHEVQSYIPASDGVHSVGAGTYTEQTSGTAITNSTTDAWTVMDDATIDTAETDYIQQGAADAASYVEMNLEALKSGGQPWAVKVLQTDRDSAVSGTNSAISRLLNGAGTAISPDIRLSTDDPGTTLTIRKKLLTAPANGWSPGFLTGLKYRCGFAGTVAPIPKFSYVYVEIAGAPEDPVASELVVPQQRVGGPGGPFVAPQAPGDVVAIVVYDPTTLEWNDPGWVFPSEY